MHDHESPDRGLTDPELTAFEARLGALAPQSRLDRDQLMFAAGRRAGGRRLRVINRVLAGTSLALAGLACLPLLSRMSADRPLRPAGGFATPLPERTPPQPSPSKHLVASDRDERSVALVEGPTNQRLLQQWRQNGESFDRPGERSLDNHSIPRGDVDQTSPSTSRELLLRYLQSTSERL